MFKRIVAIALLLVLGMVAPARMVALAADAGDTDARAAAFIEAQLAQYDHRLYVFRDFGDGGNTFTQKAFMGEHYRNIPEMAEHAEGYEGISGIQAHLNLREHTWGGYMFVTGWLPAGAEVPEVDNGSQPGGYDLSGASKLVFWAKGETGKEQVEFFMGAQTSGTYPDTSGKATTGYVKLSQEWQRYEIPLSGRDLTRINNGFGWVANDEHNRGLSDVVFSIDEIYYEFDEKQSPPILLPSYESAPIGTDDYVLNNFAFSYDNAMAVMALCYAGKLDRAAQIADALVFAIENDREYDDGRVRNAYSSGDPRSFPNWYSGKGTAFARMPGFYDLDGLVWREDKFTVSTAVGNAAWVMLALMEAYHSIGEVAYLDAAKTVGDFVLTLQSPTGGFMAGYDGWDSVPLTYKSTEHNIDLISAYALLAGATDGETAETYRAASDDAKAFVLAMYDAERGCFYTGTGDDGVTISKDVLPLDTNTWAILAMPDFADADKAMRFVEDTMRVGDGYDFNQDRDGVWFEGTAQVAVTYHAMGMEDEYQAIMDFLLANTREDGSIMSADREGVTTGFDWEYGARVHLGATAWLAFAELGRNPFEVR